MLSEQDVKELLAEARATDDALRTAWLHAPYRLIQQEIQELSCVAAGAINILEAVLEVEKKSGDEKK